MVNENVFLAHYQDVKKHFLHSLHQTIARMEEEDIHQLRVAIKKLRTLSGPLEKQSAF